MCKITETEYKCGHSTTASRPCGKAKESNSTWGCLRSSKTKYCSHPREEKKEYEGLCDKCRGRAASKTRQDRSASKSRTHPAHNENIRIVKETATERREFFLQEGAPSRGRNKEASQDQSRGRSRDKSRSEFEGKSKDISTPFPPQRGSITNYKSKPLPQLPPNSSKSSKIGGSFASTSRSTSRDGRPLVPPPRHGPYIPDNATTAVPAPLRPRRLSESHARPPRGNENAPIRESRRFENPGPAPSVPYPAPQACYKYDLPEIVAAELEQERFGRERGRDPNPRPASQQRPSHQPYTKNGFKPHDQGQQQRGQVSSQSQHYPPNASRQIETPAPVPRRKRSKTSNEAADNFFVGSGRSRSASKTRERSFSRSRGSKHDKYEKKHHKQPSAASALLNKIRAGLGHDDDGSDSDDSMVCQKSRALERGESIRPSTATPKRTSYHAGDYYMHGRPQA